MSGVRSLNPNAESMGSKAALFMNINAASGLQDVMKTNLGPRGTIKMLVSGAGDIKLTKARGRGRQPLRLRAAGARTLRRARRACAPGAARAAGAERWR